MTIALKRKPKVEIVKEVKLRTGARVIHQKINGIIQMITVAPVHKQAQA